MAVLTTAIFVSSFHRRFEFSYWFNIKRSTSKNEDEKSPAKMADNKGAGKDDKKSDDQKFAEKEIKRFDAAYECSNEDCKKRNNGQPYEYESNTYARETHRACPKCGTINRSHSGGCFVGDWMMKR